MGFRRLSLLAAACGLAGLGGFVAWKTHAVALELTDPPFYRPQPLERVSKTYEELAQGDTANPGGTWHSEDVAGLELWTLKRHLPAKGTVLLLHGFGDDRWGTSPALRWFPNQDAAIFTYLRRDDALRLGTGAPYVTFGAQESSNVVSIVHHLEATGTPRNRIILMGRSLGASVGLLALAKLEAEGPLGGFIWEGAPASSRDFGERLVRGPRDRFWHPILAPLIGDFGSRWAARRGNYQREDTDLLRNLGRQRFRTPSLCFLATEDRLATPAIQREVASRFESIQTIEVPTWHLHCAEVLGPKYAEAIQHATTSWMQ
ncbi:MAG: alpha/beta fold hydrolase [Holophaga sp.]|nr:alpha/beta fold hydrolase [Holophaga sp.]